MGTTDNCCFLCRGPYGRCLTNYGCDHHVRALNQESGPSRITYRDPTANKAIARADRALRKRRRKER